jgi:hypothetical protein
VHENFFYTTFIFQNHCACFAAYVVQHSVALLRLLVYTSIPVACHLKNYPQTNMHGVVALAMRRHLSSAAIKALKFVIGAEPKQAEEPGRRPSA